MHNIFGGINTKVRLDCFKYTEHWVELVIKYCRASYVSYNQPQNVGYPVFLLWIPLNEPILDVFISVYTYDIPKIINTTNRCVWFWVKKNGNKYHSHESDISHNILTTVVMKWMLLVSSFWDNNNHNNPSQNFTVVQNCLKLCQIFHCQTRCEA